MRITKKIISLLLVVSMIASFMAMTGFEASANLQNQQKTDFGIHFDDTTRKLKVLQLPDIQTSVSGGSISERTRETVRLLMQRYNPDVILLTGDQTQGGSTSTKAQWESAIGRVYSTFSPYMKSNCKVIATPGNHEYDFGSLNHQWDYQMGNYSYFVDWDNNFSTIDLDGAPGAGNVTVSASSTNKAVALNFAMINSKGDEEDGYLRPGGDNETAYQQIVDWYTNMNNALASSAYSYKAQVTGQASAYVPTLASQHVILQEIYTTGAMIAGDATNGVVTPSRYTHLTDASYVRLDPANNPTGAMNEGPCPTWLYNGATRALYDALHNPGNCLGMTFGHDHDNWFDVTDDNGFRFIMGGALTQENYNTDENPKGRYFEFTLNDATGEVDMTTEVKSYTQLAIGSSADVDEDRIEVINGEGVQLVNTLSVPKTVYIGASENLADVRAKQEFGTVVQTQLLDYKTKLPYDQDLVVSYCLPSGATDVTFSAHRTSAGTQASMTNLGTETTSEGVLYKYKITPESALTAGEYINYTVTYTYSGVKYEIRNSTVVENIKQPAGYNDWFRGWRESNNSKHYVDLAYVSTLSGANAYSYSRETSVNTGEFNSNTYYNYSLMIADVDQSWYNKAGDTRFSMFRYSPSRVEVTEGHVSQRAIYASPVTDIYLDSSALTKVSATDSRLDTGVSIDFWVQKDLDRGFNEYVAGIGFYAGDQDYVPGGATIDPNDQYASYNAAVTAENSSTGSDGAQDNATIFLYDSYARQQSLNGLGTTHVNANLSADNLIGKMAGQYVGYPLVVDSEAAALALNGQTMTMFTGVRNKGNSDGGYRILLYAVSPFLLNFHTYDKSDLRELAMAELMNPRKQSDYPNATQMMWDAYMAAYQNALNCYAQIKTTQTDINNYDTALENAIAALLNSNKGKPDEGNLLKGTSQFGTIDVPPIIYVSGSTIQTASPYTDRTIKFDVPTGATNVSCIVVNAGNDNVNSAVTTSTTQSGTHFETTITGGTATAGGSIYYKLSYTLNQDLNGDGKNDTYTQYAASYVKGVPNKEGMWIHQTYRQRANADANSAIYMKTTLTMDDSIFASRGVSGIMSLYGGVQGDSFHTSVVNGTTNEYTRYGDEGVYWAVGSASQWPRESGYGAAGRVLFFNDRTRAKENGDPVYWNGLQPYKKDGSGTLNTMANNSDEYVVANIYYDPQATGAGVQPRLKLTLTTSSNDSNNPTVYQYWDANNYRGVNYGGDYVNKSPNMTSTGMFTASQASNNYWSSGNGITLNDGAVWEVYLNTSKPLRDFGTTQNKETYSRLMIHAEKLGDSWLGDVWNNSIMGYAFIFNRVDRSQAHQAIKWATGQELVSPSALFNEDDMDPDWWSQWRAEIMKAYTKCGNLWETTDFDTSLLVNLWQNPVYKDADYSRLVNTLNSITGNALVNESISDYEALTFAVSSGDDQRYAGSRYAKEMFINNAADLIATIKNRVTVYAETDSNLIAASDAAGNLHDSHLDVRFQSYINDYADALQEAWDKLRLAPADYTYFDKYAGYYSEADDTITFMRNEYAGYHNDVDAKNYANEKALASGMYTYATYTAFKNSLNIDPTLKKPSENAVITIYNYNADTGAYEDSGKKLDRLYPQTFTYKNVTAPDVADTTTCLYNKARDAYEALEFRKAGEYYSADGTYTEGGVTYYANYNKQDRGASYYYTPVFRTNYNSLSADITNAGYVVTDNKVAPTYNKGNNGDTNGNGTYDAGEIWVTNGAGEYIKAINPWTDASWGDVGYGFADAYKEQLIESTSTYQSTKESSKWVLALYVEAQILPDIASVDYYYDKLVPSSYDMSQLEIQQHSYAEYEKGGSGYDALAGYIIYDENGNVLTDGAQWYTADTWAEYQTAKTAQPSIIDGATLAENQDAINAMTQIVYQKRAALQLRPMDDFRVDDANAILGQTKFEDINNAAATYNTEIANKVVKVFKSRYDAPQSLGQVQGNGLYFADHSYYTDAYKNSMSAALTAIHGYSGKPMATNIANYKAAIDAYVALYGTRESNLNGADYSGLTMLLNKTWIPTYEQYGEGNRPENNWALGMDKTGADWYTAESWQAYYDAREAAMKFFEGQTSYSTQSGYNQAYGDTGANGIATNGLKVDSQGDGAVDVEGSINKATYDLLVAYYKLTHKKVSDFDGTLDGITGSYASINEQLDAMLLAKQNETVDVVILNAAGELETVQKSIYGDEAIAKAQALAANITALAGDNLGESYSEYVEAVNAYKNAIENLEPTSVYLDGWNDIIAHLNENAGDTITIADSGTMTSYFNAVYTGFNPATNYAEGGQSINNIFSTKAMYDGFGLSAKQGQAQYNALITNLYNELKAASFTPNQVTRAGMSAAEKLSQGSQAAYDPLQLNGRPKAQGVSKYSPASVTAAQNLVTSVSGTKVTLWDTDPTVTGYNDNAGTVVDGTLADEIWAAVGLISETGTKDYDGADRDERYLLVEGGQFLDALNDAIAYANGELYEDDGVTVKQFEIAMGDGTVTTDAIFTDESVEQLVAALEAAVVTDATTQAEIDRMVFDILEQTDIENKIFLLAEDGTFYGTLNNIAEDDGLKYKPADYTYFDEELATAFPGESDGAQAIIDMVWIDNGDGTFALDNPNGSKYFTSDTWTPYFTTYTGAVNNISRDLTAKDQAKINNYTTGIYDTRNALAWNGVDDNTWAQITDIENTIGNLESATFEVLTFTNSKVQILDDGTRVLTAPEIGSKYLSAYGDVSHILSLWATFRANYLDAEGIDITKQAEMLEKLQEIRDILASLETKRFDTDESNEFTEGVRNLVDSFIAGTYTFNGLSSSNGVGTYVADYQTVADGTNVNAYEQLVRDEQRIFIQSKLNALYTIIGSGMEVGDQYQDHSTGSIIVYTTAIEAVNAIASELYEYLTNTPAQYAGFGLDMRQDMYDYLSTEIVVEVDYRYANTSPLYTKSIPMFKPEKLEEAKTTIDGTGEEGNFGEFGNADGWPTINQLDTSVGLELNENTAVEDLTFVMPGAVDDGEISEEEKVYVNGNALSFVNGYSYIYSDAHGAVNYHNAAALDWLINEAVVDTGDGIYFLADTNGVKEVDGAVFHYTMDVSARRDGDWYNKGYGTDLNQDGTRYYLASHPENVVTDSNYGGWFTDATYEAVMQQRDDSAAYIDYSGYTFGSGPKAFAKRESIENSPTKHGVCWNEANRTAYLNAIKEDQGEVDSAASSMYEKLCLLQLLPATDAYRYVAGLIYDALGLIPSYSDDNTTGIIIPEGADPDTVGSFEANEELGGRLFNLDLLEYLAQYTTVEDEEGNPLYYSLQLPGSYNGGAAAVEAILALLQAEIDKGIVTIDKADALVLADTNSVKSRVVTELEKLTLGLADLSKITSLTAAFLYNNPANDESLGSYDMYDNGVGEQFFTFTHTLLANGGNAKNYRGNEIMAKATGIYNASGFYDFSKYTEDSLRDVISFLKNSDIITATLQATANNFNIENKTGFDIVFDPKTNGGELYNTPATQQDVVDAIYEELVAVINAMELQKADTTNLKEEIASGNDVELSEDIYDHEAVDNAGKNIWDEFVAALENANNYKDVTIINQNQVLEAEDRLEKAIKALVLYVDTFAPVVTIHNTQTDLSKFYKEHASELANTITSADQMVTASYMEPGLGGYTLYVYTNQLNPHIVVSLKDTTNVLNADGSARTVTASKPEKMSVSAQAMNGVSANVITPVLDANTGMPLSSVSTKLTGAATMTAQTAKNAEGTYDAESSAYIILNPQFSDTDGVQQAAAYTISATDSAVTKDAESGEIFDSVNGVETFKYANNTELIETTEDGKITVFVYYMNSMPADGSDSGIAADGTVNGSAILTYAEDKGLAADEWNGVYGLLRKFNSAVKNWEFSDINEDLNKGAVYVDPTFGENNFGSFIYKLDPTATEGLDYDIANIYFKEGADAAKAAFINALKSNVDYIAAFDTESKKADSTKYIPFGANENWDQHLAFIDNGTLLFAHVADRFGNVCNRIIEVKNYDQLAPQLTAEGTGAVSVVEPGGSGVAKVDLFNYMGTQGSSLYIDYLFNMLHINDFTYVSEDNTFTIKAGAASAGKLFTVAVTDKAGNVGSVSVTADENGDIVVTVVETFDNVAEYAANDTKVDVNASEDLEVIEFVFNSNETIKLNYIEPSSIVKAGPDGNVFANKKNVPLNITTKSEVEAVKLYNVATGTEEIWTADNATVTDNGNGTKTWTVKYKFTEGEHNYIATAKVDGDWETFGVDFNFEATTKKVTVKLTVAGIGNIGFGYNEGNYSDVPVMSQKTVPYGSVVTLQALQTEEGSDFYYWINNGSNRIISAAETYKFTAVTNMDLTTQFTTNECFDNDKRLVVYVNNAENVIENFELAEGEDYKVPAAPSLPDHVFKSWSMTKDEILASDEMMIVVRPVYSLVVKNTVTLTEGNCTTTGAGVYESVDNERALVTISASTTDNAGAAFLYWLDAQTGDIASYNRTYSFHAIKDTELTPVYGDASAVVPAPVARISTVKYDSSAKKVNFYAERSIPAEYELIMTGVIVTKTASVGTDEAAFVLDAAGVGKGVSKSTAPNGFYTGAVSATAGTTVYARAYVVYQNADGDIITSYSPIASYTV